MERMRRDAGDAGAVGAARGHGGRRRRRHLATQIPNAQTTVVAARVDVGGVVPIERGRPRLADFGKPDQKKTTTTTKQQKTESSTTNPK